METLKKTFILFFAIMAVNFVSCNREAELTFSDFDKNNDDLIALEEFEETFTDNFYKDWNTNDDDYLDDEDFYTTVYDMSDVDGDNRLTEKEWKLGYDNYYGDFIIDDYNAIDLDKDGYIEFNEYGDALTKSEFYSSWDIDKSSYLDEKELANGLFRIWDIDNSGYMEKDEYKKFDIYYLDI